MIFVFLTPIAGINFHAQEVELEEGPILGYAKPNPVEADKDAIGLFNLDDKLLGFIPAKYLDKYKTFLETGQSGEDTFMFAGNVRRMKKTGNPFVGNIAIVNTIDESEDTLRKVLQDYLQKDLNLYGEAQLKEIES